MISPSSPSNAPNINLVESLIAAAIQRLRVSNDHVVELRALRVPTCYGAPINVAGWFDDPAALVSAAANLDHRGAQVYVTLNPVKPALLCRAHNRVIERPKSTTSDHDIERRVWLPIDVDPVRPAETSSSEEELNAARIRALEVAVWLSDRLDAKPDIWACSGNGFHLLFRLDLPNDANSTSIVQNLINTTADRFSDEQVSIDRSVFNAARIWRLYGTTNKKGDSVPKLGRIHRRAMILGERFE